MGGLELVTFKRKRHEVNRFTRICSVIYAPKDPISAFHTDSATCSFCHVNKFLVGEQNEKCKKYQIVRKHGSFNFDHVGSADTTILDPFDKELVGIRQTFSSQIVTSNKMFVYHIGEGGSCRHATKFTSVLQIQGIDKIPFASNPGNNAG